MIVRILRELIKRRVLHAGAAYLASSLVILRLAEKLGGLFGLTERFQQLLALALLVGFPFALVWVWRHGAAMISKNKSEQAASVEVEMFDDGGTQALSLDPNHMRKILITAAIVLALVIVAVVVDRLIPKTGPVAESTISGGLRESHDVKPIPHRSIAVLPFVNMSSDPEQEYFSDGLSEELLNLLAKIPELHVTSRSSAFAFKGEKIDIPEVAKKLKVAHILEGSVRKGGDRVRITAQLIEAQPDKHLWSETYDRSLVDVFAVQDEIAAEVVKELSITLLGRAPMATETEPEAYDLYLQARQLERQGSAESMREAVGLFEQALTIDPDYVPAWNGLNSAYRSLASSNVMGREEAYLKALKATERALAVDPNNAIAYSGLGWHANVYEGDYAASAGYYTKALELAPNDPKILSRAAVLLYTLGRIDEAIRLETLVTERDPLNPTAFTNLAASYYAARDFNKAVAAIDRALALSPEDVLARWWRSYMYYVQRDYQSCLESYDSLAENTGLEAFRLAGQAAVYPRIGREAEGATAMERLETEFAKEWAYMIARIHADNRRPDEAFEWLEKVYEFEGPYGLSRLGYDTPFDPLRQDPRWLPLLAKANLSDKQIAAIEFEVALRE